MNKIKKQAFRRMLINKIYDELRDKAIREYFDSVQTHVDALFKHRTNNTYNNRQLKKHCLHPYTKYSLSYTCRVRDANDYNQMLDSYIDQTIDLAEANNMCLAGFGSASDNDTVSCFSVYNDNNSLYGKSNIDALMAFHEKFIESDLYNKMFTGCSVEVQDLIYCTAYRTYSEE